MVSGIHHLGGSMRSRYAEASPLAAGVWFTRSANSLLGLNTAIVLAVMVIVSLFLGLRLSLLLTIRMETAEAAQVDFFALCQGFRYLAQHVLDHLLGVFLCQLCGFGKLIDQVLFGHWVIFVTSFY
jgi:hypothetical protein